MMRVIYLLFLSVILCGTVVAQNRDTLLKEPLPQGWNEGEFFNQTMPPDDTWWHNFEDPVLDSIIVVACKQNNSVLLALENIKKAEATWRKSQSGLMPDVGLSLGWQRAKTSGNTAQSLYKEAWDGYYSAAASMKWQADVFGSVFKSRHKTLKRVRARVSKSAKRCNMLQKTAHKVVRRLRQMSITVVI